MASNSPVVSPKSKGKYWTHTEIDILLDAIQPHHEELVGKFTKTLTKAQKELHWAGIAEK